MGAGDLHMRNKATTADTTAKQINSNEATKILNLCIENSSKIIGSSRPIQLINCTITNYNVIDK